MLSALESFLAELPEVPDPDKHLISIPENLRVKTITSNRGVRNTGGSMTNIRKCKVLCPGQGNPQYQHRLQINSLRPALVKKGFGDTGG